MMTRRYTMNEPATYDLSTQNEHKTTLRAAEQLSMTGISNLQVSSDLQLAHGSVDDFYSAGVKEVNRRKGIEKLLFNLFPKPLLKQVVYEIHMFFVRLRSGDAIRHNQGKTNLLVNVGAGDAGKAGWINLDGYRAKGITLRWDARKSLPFPDKSVKGIFAEHVFEHIDYREEAPRFLAEARRVLKDNGVLRIIVPDAEKYLRAYVKESWSDLISLRPLNPELKDHHFDFKYSTRMELVNVVFRQGNEHKFAYDFETLSLLLKRNGFQRVVKQKYGECIDTEVCIDLEIRASESLYVDCQK